MLQVTGAVADILKEEGWSVTSRGEIDVKGKGRMHTYYVDPNSPPTAPRKKSGTTSYKKASQDLRNDRMMKGRLSSLKSLIESRRNTFVVSGDSRSNSIASEVEDDGEGTTRKKSQRFMKKTMSSLTTIRASIHEASPEAVCAKSFRSVSLDHSENCAKIYDTSTEDWTRVPKHVIDEYYEAPNVENNSSINTKSELTIQPAVLDTDTISNLSTIVTVGNNHRNDDVNQCTENLIQIQDNFTPNTLHNSREYTKNMSSNRQNNEVHLDNGPMTNRIRYSAPTL